jgi:dTDP-4-dehydrorhamnose reductase
MRILVTGASGLLGLNLALEAAKQHTVFGTMNSHPIKTKAFEVLRANLLDPGALDRVLTYANPDWVIHCAALANLEACEANPALAKELNTDLPEKLATIVARGGARLLHVSTDAVFDGQRGNYSEDDQPEPLSVYARTKYDGEQVVAGVNPEAIVARVNLFGWSLSGKRSLAEFFYYNLAAGKQVMGFTDVYFCPLLANDLAQIFLEMLATGLQGLYHVVSSECITKYDFALRLSRQFSFDSELISPTSVTEGGLKAVRSPNLTLKSDKLAKAINNPLPGLSTGMKRFYTLYQQGYPQKLFGMRLGSGRWE